MNENEYGKFEILVGDFISEGVHRKVYNHKKDNTLVIKVKKDSHFDDHSKIEVLNWINSNEDIRKWLAPIVDYSKDYRYTIQKKIKLGYECPKNLPTFLKKYPPDIKSGHKNEKLHWGKFEDRLVLCDYGRVLFNSKK